MSKTFSLRQLLIAHTILVLVVALIALRLNSGANQYARERKAITTLESHGIYVSTRPTKDHIIRWCLPHQSARVHTVHIPHIGRVTLPGEEIIRTIKVFDELFWILGSYAAEPYSVGAEGRLSEADLRHAFPQIPVLIKPRSWFNQHALVNEDFDD